MPCTSDENRKNALAFYDLMFNQCKPREAIERYVGASYTQHNPHVADGKVAFVEYFERMAQEYPGKQVADPERAKPRERSLMARIALDLEFRVSDHDDFNLIM
jgi:hypothetical protein